MSCRTEQSGYIAAEGLGQTPYMSAFTLQRVNVIGSVSWNPSFEDQNHHFRDPRDAEEAESTLCLMAQSTRPETLLRLAFGALKKSGFDDWKITSILE